MQAHIYSKCGPYPTAAFNAIHHPHPNVGLEAHTFLSHIIATYDNLPTKTVFAQGSAPTVGFRGHKRGGGHMLPEVDFAFDYLCPCSAPIYLPTCAALRVQPLPHQRHERSEDRAPLSPSSLFRCARCRRL